MTNAGRRESPFQPSRHCGTDADTTTGSREKMRSVGTGSSRVVEAKTARLLPSVRSAQATHRPLTDRCSPPVPDQLQPASAWTFSSDTAERLSVRGRPFSRLQRPEPVVLAPVGSTASVVLAAAATVGPVAAYCDAERCRAVAAARPIAPQFGRRPERARRALGH